MPQRAIPLVLVLYLFAGWVFPHSSRAAVYWGNVVEIGAATPLGVPDFSYFTPDRPPVASGLDDRVCDVAVNDSHLYWLTESQISRVSLDGSRKIETIVGGLQRACGIALSSTHVYWTSRENGQLGRARLDGAEANPAWISGLKSPSDVAVGGSHIYWSQDHGIGRATLEGTEVVSPVYLGPTSDARGVAVDDRYVYWSDASGGDIGRATLDGAQIEPNFLATQGWSESIAVDSSRILWTQELEGGVAPALIGSANLDGSAANQSWVTNNASMIGGIALDARSEPAQIVVPLEFSRRFRFGKPWRPKNEVAVFVNFKQPGIGRVDIGALGVRWQVTKRTRHPSSDGSIVRTIKVWPAEAGYFARKVHKWLQRRGRASIPLEITFFEPGKIPTDQDRRVVLKALRK